MTETLENARREIFILEKEAKSSKNKLRSFFESSSTIHLLIDTNLRLIDFNRAAAIFIRQHHKVHIKPGKPVHEFLHKDHLQSFFLNFDKAISGLPVRVEQELQYDDGRLVVWFINYEPAWDCEGNILGISFNAVDITEKLANERMIVSQHRCLQEIAYIQSHHMRGPVGNIVGLMNLFKSNGSKLTKAGFGMLQRAVNELESQLVQVEKLAALK